MQGSENLVLDLKKQRDMVSKSVEELEMRKMPLVFELRRNSKNVEVLIYGGGIATNSTEYFLSDYNCRSVDELKGDIRCIQTESGLKEFNRITKFLDQHLLHRYSISKRNGKKIAQETFP